MARMLGFGQPFGGVMQTAFVVEDVHASIAHFQKDCAAGPFFLLDHFLGPDQFYRGAPSTADVMIAMGFIGHMQVELIQPLDGNPSVYRETIEKRGYGFHHFGIALTGLQARVQSRGAYRRERRLSRRRDCCGPGVSGTYPCNTRNGRALHSDVAGITSVGRK